jgi:peptidoglycan/LPS O-acetylase OafA/YrhL
MQYRPDVDGLRMVAVGAVVLFHLQVPYVTGGYVGVDIFFVISGYLISAILFSELETGRYSLLSFYERRARRILPALFLVLVATAAAACVLMIPPDIVDVGKSTLATLAFVANFYFWQTSGYFAGAAELQPLLHMWSLAVEEQFYIVFPLFLWLGFRIPRHLFLLLFWGLASGSLAVSIYGAVYYPTASFYVPVTRAWELMTGAVVARPDFLLPLMARRLPGILNSALSLAGLAAVAAPVFILDPNSAFPGINSISPVLGAALVILTGRNGPTPVARVLSLRPVVRIGLISYSLYLWHWPIWVLSGEFTWFDRQQAWPKLALVALSVLLAWASWRFVEAPFRDRSKTSRAGIFRFSAAGGTFLATLALVMFVFPSAMAMNRLTAAQLDLVQYEDYRDLQEFPHADCFVRRSSDKGLPGSCPAKAGSNDTLIWGDSFAEQLVPGLMTWGGGGQLLQVTSGGCPPLLYLDGTSGRELCRAYSRLARSSIAMLSPERVIIAARWELYDGHWGIDLLDQLEESLVFLHSSGVKEVVVVGLMPTWRGTFPRVVLRASVGDVLPKTIPLAVAVYDSGLDDRLREVTLAAGYKFVELKAARCPGGVCPVFASNGEVMQWDSGHLTVGGSADVIGQIAGGFFAGDR